MQIPKQNMNDISKTKRRYNRQAFFYDLMGWPMEKWLFSDWHQQFLSPVRGKVLEIGVGTGKNFPHYRKEVELTAIDVSEKMLRQAERRAEVLNRFVDLRLMDAQRLEFEDESFDTVVGTFVFCSVPDLIRGLKEVRRVLRPGSRAKEKSLVGRLLLLEHVRLPGGFSGALMDVLDPLIVRLSGFYINRRTVENVRQAGFRKVDSPSPNGPLFKYVKAAKWIARERQ